MGAKLRGLEIGCGRSRYPGCDHGIDANPNVFTAEELSSGKYKAGNALELPWDDGYFQRVIAIDVLEHIPFRHTQEALNEWARVLQAGGEMYAQVPDAGKIMADYASGAYVGVDARLPGDLKALPNIYSAIWRIMGGQDDGDYTRAGDDYFWNIHQTMFDAASLRWHVEAAGLKVVEMTTNIHPNLCCTIMKPAY